MKTPSKSTEALPPDIESTGLEKLDNFDPSKEGYSASGPDCSSVKRAPSRSINQTCYSVISIVFSKPIFRVALGVVGLAGIVSVFVFVGKFGRNMHPLEDSRRIEDGGI
jgi:hypothetical protein